MNHFLLKIGDEELKLRIRTKSHAEIKMRLGESFFKTFQDESKAMDVFEHLPPVLHAALQAFPDENGKYTYDDTCNLVDRLVDEGYTFEQLFELEMNILEASGFFPKGTAESMRAETMRAMAQAQFTPEDSSGTKHGKNATGGSPAT